MAKQTGSLDLAAQKRAHDEAAQKATKYITDLADGIMVHPEGDETSGWSIRSALELLKDGASFLKAWLDNNTPKIRLGLPVGSSPLAQATGNLTLTPGGLITEFIYYNSSLFKGAYKILGDSESNWYLRPETDDSEIDFPTGNSPGCVRFTFDDGNSRSGEFLLSALFARFFGRVDATGGVDSYGPLRVYGENLKRPTDVTYETVAEVDLDGNASLAGDLDVTGNITGTWAGNAVPVNKGGTGATTAAAARTALGAASSSHTHTAAEVGALPDTTAIPSKTSDLTNDSGFFGSSSVVPTANGGTGLADFGTYTNEDSGSVSVSSGTSTTLKSFTLGAGTWLVVGSFQFASNGSGRRCAAICTTQNRAPNAVNDSVAVAPANGSVTDLCLTQVLKLSASTTYHANVMQNSGSALSCRAYVRCMKLAAG